MINIRNIATYVPNNYLNLNNRFINIKKNFLTSKIGAIKVSRMKKSENVVEMCVKSFKNLSIQLIINL